MITVVRTANIQDGKFIDAFAWAVKATGYVREKLGTNAQLSRNIGGPTYQVHWVSTYPSLADFEKAVKRMEADEGYKSLIEEARQQRLFIGTSIVDALYESIP
jgi:hypothetical protein